jgi:pyrroline-5-carboxylate reductase
MMADLLAQLSPILKEREDRFILVTMAAGLTIERIRELAVGDYPVIRIMPNTPASIGEGMILYTAGSDVLDIELQIFLAAMAGAGRLSPLPEHLMDAGSAVSGCGPAFVDLFIEALADGGVACGLPRASALEFAAQMVAGSAKLVLESGKHPGVLKDAVCSPGGTTIQGVRALEPGNFRGTVMEAVIKAYEKNFDLK